jgi:hypothetical protein
MYETTKIALPWGSPISKFPSKSAATPVVLPFTTTDAPGNGTLFSSTTVPENVVCE